MCKLYYFCSGHFIFFIWLNLDCRIRGASCSNLSLTFFLSPLSHFLSHSLSLYFSLWHTIQEEVKQKFFRQFLPLAIAGTSAAIWQRVSKLIRIQRKQIKFLKTHFNFECPYFIKQCIHCKNKMNNVLFNFVLLFLHCSKQKTCKNTFSTFGQLLLHELKWLK